MRNVSTVPESAGTPSEVEKRITVLARRVRSRTRILAGTGLSQGHNPNPATVAAFQDEQRTRLAELVNELAHWEAVQAGQSPAAPDDRDESYSVPVDPMDDLECDSCQ